MCINHDPQITANMFLRPWSIGLSESLKKKKKKRTFDQLLSAEFDCSFFFSKNSEMLKSAYISSYWKLRIGWVQQGFCAFARHLQYFSGLV